MKKSVWAGRENGGLVIIRNIMTETSVDNDERFKTTSNHACICPFAHILHEPEPKGVKGHQFQGRTIQCDHIYANIPHELNI